jgi:SAM-dependent methyltransferase
MPSPLDRAGTMDRPAIRDGGRARAGTADIALQPRCNGMPQPRLHEEGNMSQGFQLSGQGPYGYEHYLVPAFFASCAEQLLEFAPVTPGQRVLDVACGTGVVARRASARAGVAGTVVGVDVNAGMIDVARTVAAAGTITWQTADAAALPFPDAAFDRVYCQQGLQFFADRPGTLREMHRVLAPGGRAGFAVWRALEHSPAAMMRAPFGWSDRNELRSTVIGAGFTTTAIRIAVVLVRFRSVEELLHHEVVSSPLAGPVGALDEDRYQALGRDLAQTLSPYTEDDGIAFPVQTWLATADR